MKLSFVAAVTAVLLGGASAHANFIALYTSNFTNVYNYTLRFTVDQPGEILRSGDTVTLYDVPVTVNASDIVSVVPPTSPAGQFTVTQQLVGITPAALVGAAGLTDNATLQNITFTYTGANRTVPQDFNGATITMIPTYSTLRVGTESGFTDGASFPLIPPVSSPGYSIRSVLLPATQGSILGPEPGSLVVMGLGAAALLVRRRRAGKAAWSTFM